jgi:hypothetical protein
MIAGSNWKIWKALDEAHGSVMIGFRITIEGIVLRSKGNGKNTVILELRKGTHPGFWKSSPLVKKTLLQGAWQGIR